MKRWTFRFLACLLAMLPVVIAEAAARLFVGSQTIASDPFVDLSNLKPLFQLSSEGDRYEIGKQRMHLFKPASFAVKKQKGTFRVFALGGSTTQGEPYSTESAFPKWLEINLSAMLPDNNVEVVNCGGLSYASYRVKAIADEVLNYKPDLIVLYTGHNEFLEKRSYQDWENRGQLRRAADWLMRRSELCKLLRDLGSGASRRQSDQFDSADKTRIAEEVDALLDYQSGLNDYHRSDSWEAGVAEQLAWNVDVILDNCKTQGVPVFAILPVCNLADCPPMKIEPSPQLSEEQSVEFDQLWEKAIYARGKRGSEAETYLREALELDSEHAGALYLMGQLRLSAGESASARDLFLRARDHDVCKLRATSQLREVMSELYSSHSVATLDAQEFFERLSSEPVLGSQWLVDHIHPSVEGHRRLAKAIADHLVASGLVSPAAQWRERARLASDEHMNSLDEAYFHRGKQRLEGLMLWTQGRAKKLRRESSAP